MAAAIGRPAVPEGSPSSEDLSDSAPGGSARDLPGVTRRASRRDTRGGASRSTPRRPPASAAGAAKPKKREAFSRTSPRPSRAGTRRASVRRRRAAVQPSPRERLLVELAVAGRRGRRSGTRARRAAAPRRRSAARRAESSRSRSAPAAMPSTSPTGRRKPSTPSSTTSGRPPAAVPMTGTPQAIASRAARPNDSASEGRSMRRAAGRIVSIAATLPRNVVRSANPALPGQALGQRAIRTVADQEQARRHPALDASKIPSTSRIRLTGRKFETCTSRASPGRASVRAKADAPAGPVEARVHEVRHDLDLALHPELADRDVLQVLRDRRHRVALLDRPAGDRQVRAVLADDRDVGAVERRDDLQPDAVAVAHLAGQDRRDRVGQGVVDVEQVEVACRATSAIFVARASV